MLSAKAILVECRCGTENVYGPKLQGLPECFGCTRTFDIGNPEDCDDMYDYTYMTPAEEQSSGGT